MTSCNKNMAVTFDYGTQNTTIDKLTTFCEHIHNTMSQNYTYYTTLLHI